MTRDKGPLFIVSALRVVGPIGAIYPVKVDVVNQTLLVIRSLKAKRLLEKRVGREKLRKRCLCFFIFTKSGVTERLN